MGFSRFNRAAKLREAPVRALVTAVLAAVLSPGVASAQQAPPPAAPFTAGWQDGFVLQTANGDYRLVLGLVAQTDGRFALGDAKPIVNTFTIRKARPTFSGRVARYFDFKVMPDFGNGAATLVDAYFDIRFSPKFRVRTGKDKTPIGYELLQGDAFLLFPERSLASSLVPNRDVGVQVQADLSPKVFYAAGVLNGIPDASSATTDADANNGKELAGRVVVQPFRSTAASTRPLNGFGFHVGGSTGQQVGALPSFRTSVGQTYFSYATGATANGKRTRVSQALFYYYKAFGALGEYVRSTQVIARTGANTRVGNEAWEVTGSMVLTGEAASDRGVRPANSFDPSMGHWGALQLVARYTELKIDRDAFAAGLAATGSSSKAKSFTIGANWYPAAYIKYYVTFERTTFGTDLTVARPAEKVVLFRTQLAF